MKSQNIYLKLNRNCQVEKPEIYLRDIGKVYCSDSKLAAKCKSCFIYRFREGYEKRVVISALKIFECLDQLEPGIQIDSIGETDVIVEWISGEKTAKLFEFVKITLVCLLSFFGAAFTIMAFHNDIGIRELFNTLYGIWLNQTSDGLGWLEGGYSFGLGAGIIVFFNHIGKKRLSKDPTPIEVAMRTYEKDVNTALVDTAGREGKTLDVFK